MKAFKKPLGLFFLILIFALWYTGKIQLWLLVLGTGLVITPFVGRIYCGWLCPITTSLRLMPTNKKPTAAKYAGILQKTNLKILLFLGFAFLFVLVRRTDFFIPFFILLIPVAYVFTLFFGESSWHRICPFGTIFSLLSSKPRKKFDFSSQDCSYCGLCQKACPNNCLHAVKNSGLTLDHSQCLACGSCEDACPQQNIVFGGN